MKQSQFCRPSATDQFETVTRAFPVTNSIICASVVSAVDASVKMQSSSLRGIESDENVTKLGTIRECIRATVTFDQEDLSFLNVKAT